MKYLALLRGVNVGGKNKIAMSELKTCFEQLGFTNVMTYINSGNVIFESKNEAIAILEDRIEKELIRSFQFDSELIKVRVLNEDELNEVVMNAPKGFGDEPNAYHYDVAFLMRVDDKEAFDSFECRPEVDVVWQGRGVVYYRRLSARRTSSRLSKIMGKPIYKSLTIRNWNTTQKLRTLLTQK